MVMALIRIQNIPVYYLTPSTTCSCHSFLCCLFLASVRFCVVERLVPVLPLISILSAEKHDSRDNLAQVYPHVGTTISIIIHSPLPSPPLSSPVLTSPLHPPLSYPLLPSPPLFTLPSSPTSTCSSSPQ